MPDLTTDAIAALQAVEDWWLSLPGHQRDHGAPACIFMVREVLARHRAAPPIFVVNGGSEGAESHG